MPSKTDGSAPSGGLEHDPHCHQPHSAVMNSSNSGRDVNGLTHLAPEVTSKYPSWSRDGLPNSAEPMTVNGKSSATTVLPGSTNSSYGEPEALLSEKHEEKNRNLRMSWWSQIRAIWKGENAAAVEARLEREMNERLWCDPSPFLFQPGDLCSLVDPENVDRLHDMGGTEGLLAGLGTHPDKGISSTCNSSENSPPFLGSVEDRVRVYGENILPERKSKSLLLLMWLALQDKILILLIVAAIVSLALGLYTDFGLPRDRVPCEHPPPGKSDCETKPVDWVEGVAIMVAVIIVDLIGSLNDWQKERQFRVLDAKKDARNVTVLRQGTQQLIDLHDVLVGDIVSFEPGEVVAYDGVVLRGHNIKCDESSITGESDMINKVTFDEYMREKQSMDGSVKRKSCFMISGSKVLEGVGEFVVTAVGPLSMNGKLMMSLRDEPENTPLQSKLNRLAELIAKLGTGAGVILFIALMIRYFVDLGRDDHIDGPKYGERFIRVLIIAVTVVVVAVPEGLPLAVTLALAFATRRMSNRNLLVRILGSCETMANATVICTDKTGTLTQNKMNVVAGCVGCDLPFQDRIKLEMTNAGELDAVLDMDELPTKVPVCLQRLMADLICINSTAFIANPSEGELAAPGKSKSWWSTMFKPKPKQIESTHATKESPFVGSKTETALLDMVIRMDWGNYDEIRKASNVVQFIPFSSKRKTMAVVVETTEGYRLFMKGASEVLLRMSSSVVSTENSALVGGVRTRTLDGSARHELSQMIEKFAMQSLRTIGLCYRDFTSWPPKGATLLETGEVAYEDLSHDLAFLALTAIEDPLRYGVSEAVRSCGKAGVQVKMCTGDNLITARSIASQCGIYTSGGIVMEGPAFKQLSDADLTEIAPRLQVLARSSPEDKKRLTEKLKSLGNVVAVTGDGTNDGPALKAANVGFSMGIAGSEVAKEASDIILLDDNFSSIVNAIMWGRCVNDAVRKFLQFQITVNIVAVIVTFVTAVADNEQTSVLTPVQLLWLNLIMDTLAALALATDPADPKSLERKPDRWSTPLITAEMWKQITVQSVYQLVLILVLNFAGKSILNMHSQERWKRVSNDVELNTLIFNVFVWCQLFNQVNARRLDRKLNIFHYLHKNIWFVLIMAIEIGVQILIVFKGGAAFSVHGLNGRDWGISIVAGFVSWPLGLLTRLIPTEPFENLLIRMHLMPDPDVLPVTAPDANDGDEKNNTYANWNEPAIGRLVEQLGAYSRIRGGRLRASNLVLKSNARLMREHDIHPKDLMAIVPGFIGASIGSTWRPLSSEAPQGYENSGRSEQRTSAWQLFSQGKMQFHPDTPQDNPYIQVLRNAQMHGS